MQILILETSSEKSLIVLSSDGKVKRSPPLQGGPTLSRTLAVEVKNLLNEEIPDAIAVGVGPGSYTGIRVGAALAKALSYGWKIPLIGFCSLEAFGPAPVLVDARSGGFYALFDKTASRISVEDERLKEGSFLSPHPELIQKRVPWPLKIAQKEADPDLLVNLCKTLFLEGGEAPFQLIYSAFP